MLRAALPLFWVSGRVLGLRVVNGCGCEVARAGAHKPVEKPSRHMLSTILASFILLKSREVGLLPLLLGPQKSPIDPTETSVGQSPPPSDKPPHPPPSPLLRGGTQ